MGSAVVLINPFEVPDDEAEHFVYAWESARNYLSHQPGYWTTSLHHSLTPEVTHPFVNVAEWDSSAHFQQAMSSDQFRAIAGAMASYPAHPALYRVIRH